jgi:hypothetical protein
MLGGTDGRLVFGETQLWAVHRAAGTTYVVFCWFLSTFVHHYSNFWIDNIKTTTELHVCEGKTSCCKTNLFLM